MSELSRGYVETPLNPELMPILERHLKEQLESGIITTYAQAMREYPLVEVPLRETAIHAEAPLVPYAESFTDTQTSKKTISLFIDKVRPSTGQSISEAAVWVADFNEDGDLIELFMGFNTEQATIVLQEYRELAEIGLYS